MKLRRGGPPARGVAFVGCGYVADYYMATLGNHPELSLVGVMDRDGARARRFGKHYSVPVFDTLDDLLADGRVQLVANLTNPRSHYEVSRRCLEAGKHVYSEKPLGMTMDEARALVALADERKLSLSGAPCGALGETAQTLWKELRSGTIGKPRLVYAELDDGPIHLMSYKTWLSDSGSPWPYRDEFEVGCTLEHAGYYVTWLAAWFGPAKTVTAYSSCLIPDKAPDMAPESHAPDFSVACIEFVSGVTARLTCSILAPHDHAIRIIGDRGILSAKDCWDYGSPVSLVKRTPLRIRAEKYPVAAALLGLGPRQVPLVRRPAFRPAGKGGTKMDFSRGIAEQVAALDHERAPRLSARFALHTNEIVLAIQRADPTPYRVESTFDAMEPMPWAR